MWSFQVDLAYIVPYKDWVIYEAFSNVPSHEQVWYWRPYFPNTTVYETMDNHKLICSRNLLRYSLLEIQGRRKEVDQWTQHAVFYCKNSKHRPTVLFMWCVRLSIVKVMKYETLLSLQMFQLLSNQVRVNQNQFLGFIIRPKHSISYFHY